MANELHSALQSLGPTSFDEVPSSHNELQSYVQDLLAKSHLIVESVPSPPLATTLNEDHNPPTQATSASEISSSSARAAPPPQSFQYDALQKEWGRQVNKPNSSASKKEKAQNPLDIPVYKLNGKDGKGAWFARRSVHEGLGFGKWKKRMEREFEETLRRRREKEEVEGEVVPGDGSIRGIGVEKRVEKIDIPETDTAVNDVSTQYKDTGSQNLGKVEVYHLSAQFPGPTAPRDFVTLLITSDMGVYDKSNTEGNIEVVAPPRSYMIISKPCDHPDTQPREGFIRGQYESVEFIREVPVDRNKKKTHFANKSESDILTQTQEEDERGLTGRRRGKTVPDRQSSCARESVIGQELEPNFQKDKQTTGETDEADMNAVEWIMITRSDPGGTVPRWMVERGTPGSIVGDAVKFLDWACQYESQDDDGEVNLSDTQSDRHSLEQDKSSAAFGADEHISGPDSDNKKMDHEPSSEQAPVLEAENSSPDDEEDDSTQHNGLIASVTGVVSSYTPETIRQYLPGQPFQQGESDTAPARSEFGTQTEDDGDKASVSSMGTFASAVSHADSTGLREAPAPKRSSSNPALPVSSSMAMSQSHKEPSPVTSGYTSKVHTPRFTKPALTSQERELAKLASRKQETEAKLAATRSEYESFATNPDSPEPDKDTQNQTPTPDRADSIPNSSSNKVDQQQQRKRAATLNRTETKLVSQINKLESQQDKLNSKIQERERKQTAREERAKGKQKIESLTQEVEMLRKEVYTLREERAGWVDLVGRLQRENTRLVAESGGRGFVSDRSSPGTTGSGSIGST